jgi:hypothetical protein
VREKARPRMMKTGGPAPKPTGGRKSRRFRCRSTMSGCRCRCASSLVFSGSSPARCRHGGRTCPILANSPEAIRPREQSKGPRLSFRGIRKREERMSDLQSQLSPDEEVALRRVALGFSHGVASDHLRRLKDLHLIEADKTSWRLTALGQRRFKSLPRAAKLASHGTPDAIAMMLARFASYGERGWIK